MGADMAWGRTWRGGVIADRYAKGEVREMQLYFTGRATRVIAER